MSMPAERELEEKNDSKMCADQRTERSATTSKENCEINTKDKDRLHSYEESIEAVVKANYSEEQVDDHPVEYDTSTCGHSDHDKQNVAVPNPDEADLPSDESNRGDCKTPENKSTNKQYEYFSKPQTKVHIARKSGQTKQMQLKFKKNMEPSKLSKKGESKKHKINYKYHLLELQRQRLEIGTWVQCTSCEKWRYLATITDPQEVDSNWKCSMNPNFNFSSCEAKEILPPALEEQDMIYSPYSVGSLVWVLQPGYPWWPAMVDDDPDVEQFYWLNDYSDIPTHYNVVFFDSEPVSRAWIPAQSILPFSDKEKNKMLSQPNINNARLRIRLAKAKKDAMRASILSLENRLQEFSFVARYKGKLHIFKDKKTKNKKKHSSADNRALTGAPKHTKKPYPKKAEKPQSGSDFKSSEDSSDSFSSDTSKESAVTSKLTTQSSAASSISSSSPSSAETPKKVTAVKTGEKKYKTAPLSKKLHQGSVASSTSSSGPSSPELPKKKATKKMVNTIKTGEKQYKTAPLSKKIHQGSVASSTSSSGPSSPEPPKKKVNTVKTMEKKDKTTPRFKKTQKKETVVTQHNPKVKESHQSDVVVASPNDQGATNGGVPNDHYTTNKETSNELGNPNDELDTNRGLPNGQHTSNKEATYEETPNEEPATEDKTLNEQPDKTGEQPEQKIKASATKVAKKIATVTKTIKIAAKKSDITKQGKKEKSGKSKEINKSSHGTLQTDMPSKLPKASKNSSQAGKPVLSVKSSTAAAAKKGGKPHPVWKKENFEKKMSNKKFSAPVIKKDADKIKTVETDNIKTAPPVTLKKENTTDIKTKVASEKKRKSAAQFKAPIIKQARDDTFYTAAQPKLETECETTQGVASPEASDIHDNPVGVDTDTQPSAAAALDVGMQSLAPLQDVDLNLQPNSPLFDMEED